MEEKSEYRVPGGVILCSSLESGTPFQIPDSDVYVYSVEELCYYLYQHVFFLSRSLFTKELAAWFLEEFHMEETAKKLCTMIEGRYSLKDIVVTILCSVDFYSEAEIRSLIRIMDEIEQLSEVKRERVKADCYFESGNTKEALKRYQKIMRMEGVLEFSPEEYGDILYQMALCYISVVSTREAAAAFLESYQRSGKRESLRAYINLLQITGDKGYAQTAKECGISEKELESMKKELKKLKDEVKELPIYQKILGLFEDKEECFHTTGLVIDRWREDYLRKSM